MVWRNLKPEVSSRVSRMRGGIALKRWDSFLKGESGAVTVDYVVLTAAIVVVAVIAVTPVLNSVTFTSRAVASEIGGTDTGLPTVDRAGSETTAGAGTDQADAADTASSGPVETAKNKKTTKKEKRQERKKKKKQEKKKKKKDKKKKKAKNKA